MNLSCSHSLPLVWKKVKDYRPIEHKDGICPLYQVAYATYSPGIVSGETLDPEQLGSSALCVIVSKRFAFLVDTIRHAVSKVLALAKAFTAEYTFKEHLLVLMASLIILSFFRSEPPIDLWKEVVHFIHSPFPISSSAIQLIYSLTNRLAQSDRRKEEQSKDISYQLIDCLVNYLSKHMQTHTSNSNTTDRDES